MKLLGKALVLFCFIQGLLLFLARPAFAGSSTCFSDCAGSCLGNMSDSCMYTKRRCEASCDVHRFGAIAYSVADGAWGYSKDWSTGGEAKRDALHRCSSRGSNCKIWAVFENECGAVAADGSTVGWGTSVQVNEAKRRAMLECSKAGGRNCSIQVWACCTK